MTFEALVAYLAVHDVRLSSSDGALSYDAPAGAVSPELLDALRAHKARLLGWLAAGVVARAPATFQQARMIETSVGLGRSHVLNVALRIRMVGGADIGALRAALTALRARHHALRTRFVQVDGAWTQEVLAAAPLDVATVDLTALPADQRDRRAEEVASEFAHQPLDFLDGDVMRAQLILLSERETVLILLVHHIVSDGWGVSVLLRDLGREYAALLGGGADRPEPPAMQCTDYAQWQRARMDAATRERNLAYWMTELDGAPLVVDLPFDRPKPDVLSGRGRAYRASVPDTVAVAAEAFARRRGTTGFAVAAATMGLLLCRLSGQRDVVLSVPYANRNDTALESLVGITGNATLLRLRLDAARTFGELVDQTARSMFAAADHQVPVAWIFEALRARRPGTPTKLSLLFTYQNSLNLNLELPGLDATVDDVRIDAARTVLSFILSPRPGGLDGSLEYSADLLDETTIEAWFAMYGDLLDVACRLPERPLSELLAAPGGA